MIYEVKEESRRTEKDCSYKYQLNRQLVKKAEENAVRKPSIF